MKRAMPPYFTRALLSVSVVLVVQGEREAGECLHQHGGVCVCCSTGWRGVNCTIPCSTCGHSYRGNNCTAFCLNNTYGTNCEMPCPRNCKTGSISSLCHKDKGICTGGCQDGLHGSTCSQACNDNCLDNRCDQATGQCVKCAGDRFGSLCGRRCSPLCVRGLCGDDNGLCDCPEGKTGTSCRKPCIHHCESTPCRFGNYLCPARCPDGQAGPVCLDYCQAGCHQGCDRLTGTCTDDQYKVPELTNVDMNTPSRCPRNSFMSVCRTDNTCWFCNIGWYGEKCDTPCFHCPWGCLKDTGECLRCRYGDNCTHPCPSSCRAGPQGESVCDPASGVCFYGCGTGSTGPECVLGASAASQGTVDSNTGTGRFTGLSVGLVLAVVVIVVLIIALVIVIRRRKHSSRSATTDETPSALLNEEQTD